MMNKYWTFDERQEYETAKSNSKNGFFSISKIHNPKSSGLEYILQLFKEIEYYKNELIIGIE